MSDCSLLGWLNLLILTGTAAVIVWYTIETKRLRQEAHLQTELQNQPFLSLKPLEFIQSEVAASLAPSRIRLVNAGRGVATNIVVDEIRVNVSTEFRQGPLITHLEPGAEAAMPWRVWLRLTPSDPFGEVVGNEHEQLIATILAQRSLTFGVHYSSIVGSRYRTDIRIEAEAARIVSVERVSENSERRIC